MGNKKNDRASLFFPKLRVYLISFQYLALLVNLEGEAGIVDGLVLDHAYSREKPNP